MLTVYTTTSWQYFLDLELHTLSTWHNSQQVDGGHYEAEAEGYKWYLVKHKISENTSMPEKGGIHSIHQTYLKREITYILIF